MGKPIVKFAGIKDVEFGDNVTVIEPVNLYECRIGDNSFIGHYRNTKRSCDWKQL